MDDLAGVTIRFSDVNRAKEFYARLGYWLDADRAVGTAFRLVQFTPPFHGISFNSERNSPEH